MLLTKKIQNQSHQVSMLEFRPFFPAFSSLGLLFNSFLITQRSSVYLHVSNQKREEDKSKDSYCYGKQNLSWICAGFKALTQGAAQNKKNFDQYIYTQKTKTQTSKDDKLSEIILSS